MMKQSGKYAPDPETLALRAELQAAQSELALAYRQFDQATAPELVESCIYRISAAKARCDYYLRVLKAREPVAAGSAKGGAGFFSHHTAADLPDAPAPCPEAADEYGTGVSGSVGGERHRCRYRCCAGTEPAERPDRRRFGAAGFRAAVVGAVGAVRVHSLSCRGGCHAPAVFSKIQF